MHICESLNVIRYMRDNECDVRVLPLQCYNVTWGNLIPQWTHAHMRITECDHINRGGGAFVITLVDPGGGGSRGASVYSELHLKIFS